MKTQKRVENLVTTNVSGYREVFGSLTCYLGYITFLVHYYSKMKKLSIRERV